MIKRIIAITTITLIILLPSTSVTVDENDIINTLQRLKNNQHSNYKTN